jgi:glycosyltransferase involved in cell wall biosynthesis
MNVNRCSTTATDVKVTALMLTFNHERHVGEAIEGFLAQETDFPCELVIAEDCSTDGTREVIRQYWEKHPDRIRVFLNRHNIGARRALARAYAWCRGEYVAYLDGDDCWTSPQKLQRQADLLDAHPEYALCFHSVEMVWEDDSQEAIVFRPHQIRDCYTLEDLFENNFIAACSPMYRTGMRLERPAWHFVGPVGDWWEHILYAQHGRIGYLDEPMGMYRQHQGGMYSMTSTLHKLNVAIEMLRRFRCALDRRYSGPISRSLSSHYRQLALVHLECGDRTAARAAAAQAVRESCHPVGRIPSLAALRTFVKTHLLGA